MEEYDFEKLAREIVSSRLKAVEKAPEAAAEIAKKIIVTGVTGTKVRQEPRLTVSAVCRGAASGMLLIEGDVVGTSVLLLKEMPAIAQEVHLDPGDLMTWSLEGIASVALLAGPHVQHSIQEKIEAEFMGVGEVFSKLCEKAKGAAGASP